MNQKLQDKGDRRYADPDIVPWLSQSQLKPALDFLLCKKNETLFRPLLMCLFIAATPFPVNTELSILRCDSFLRLNTWLISYPTKILSVSFQWNLRRLILELRVLMLRFLLFYIEKWVFREDKWLSRDHMTSGYFIYYRTLHGVTSRQSSLLTPIINHQGYALWGIKCEVRNKLQLLNR